MAIIKTAPKHLTASYSNQRPTGLPSASRETGVGFLQDLWGFMRVRKKYWLFPLITVLLLFGFMIVFTSGTAIAPFIYTLF
jgi:hypothetical protein